MPKYNDDILNYYNDNTHTGSFDKDEENIGTGMVGSPSCGDVMKLQIKIDPKDDRIIDAKILVFGCGSAKASSSYVAKQLIGKTIQEAKEIKNTDIAEALGLPRLKLHCSVLAEDAIKEAIKDYQQKQNPAIEQKSKQKEKTSKNSDKCNNFFVEITDEALNFTVDNLKKTGKNTIGIRLAIEEGHCGLMYKVHYVSRDEDISNYVCFETNGLKIFAEKKTSDILNGTIISYKEENLKRGLIFKNPKETGRCSCGVNFFTEKKKKKTDKKNSCKS